MCRAECGRRFRVTRTLVSSGGASYSGRPSALLSFLVERIRFSPKMSRGEAIALGWMRRRLCLASEYGSGTGACPAGSCTMWGVRSSPRYDVAPTDSSGESDGAEPRQNGLKRQLGDLHAQISSGFPRPHKCVGGPPSHRTQPNAEGKKPGGETMKALLAEGPSGWAWVDSNHRPHRYQDPKGYEFRDHAPISEKDRAICRNRDLGIFDAAGRADNTRQSLNPLRSSVRARPGCPLSTPPLQRQTPALSGATGELRHVLGEGLTGELQALSPGQIRVERRDDLLHPQTEAHREHGLADHISSIGADDVRA